MHSTPSFAAEKVSRIAVLFESKILRTWHELNLTAVLPLIKFHFVDFKTVHDWLIQIYHVNT